MRNKIRVREAPGPALDWAVAKCEGVDTEYINDGITKCLLRVTPFTGRYSPATNWSQGGPIIERERISVVDVDGYDFWKADKLNKEAIPVISYGPTPLIAAMRCYVASKLGDEVEVPEELCPTVSGMNNVQSVQS